MPGSSQSQKFEDFSDRLLKTYFDSAPSYAVYLGLHDYDNVLPDLSKEGIQKTADSFKALKDELSGFDENALSPEEKFDFDIARWAIDANLFEFTGRKSHENNPMHYTYPFSGINEILGKGYAPFADRMKSVFDIMRQVPGVLANAKKNLRKNVPSIFCKYAKGFCDGYIQLFGSDLKELIIEKGADENLLNEYRKVSEITVGAFKDYIKYIDNELIPNADDSYPIGEEMFYEMMSMSEQIDIPIEKLDRMGQEELKILKDKMNDLLVRHNMVGKLDSIEKEHPTEENLISETETTLIELTEFIREKDIVDLPEKLNCIVTEMPAYMNIGFAAMGTAGPYDKTDESFYYVNLPDKEWNQKKKDEWLTLFNYPTLKVISIHEAFPGHYTHFLNVNQKASKLAKVFMSYSYIEGWAHYTEEMMLDEGFDIDNPNIRLAQLKEALIRCCRYIVAIGLHTKGMTVDEATDFFMKNAHMNETTARQEAERGTYDPGYLNYTLGKIFLKKLRDEFFEKYKDTYTLKDFHNKIVSYGAPTFRIVEKHMLNGVSEK